MSTLVRDASQLVPDLVAAMLARDRHGVESLLLRGTAAYGEKAVLLAAEVALQRATRELALLEWKRAADKLLGDT